jgi:hypothetical protein
LGLILLLAVQVWLAFRVDRSHPVSEYDEAVYADIAREYVRTGIPSRRLGTDPRFYYIHPYLQTTLFWGRPLAEAAQWSEEDSPYRALHHTTRLRWVTTVFALLTILLLFLGCWIAAGPLFALVVAALLTLNPLWLRFSHLIYLEVPLAFWIAASLFATGYGLDRTKAKHPTVWFLMGGLSLGAAVITKYLALIWGVAGFVLLLGLFFRQRLRVWDLLAWLAGTAAVSMTWPVFIWRKGSLPDWIEGSLSRWTSFQTGPGGDPRTEWGVFSLLRFTIQEIGPVHSFLLAAGMLLAVVGVLCWNREVAEILLRDEKSSDRPPKAPEYLLPHFALLTLFLPVWILSPTKDPKFLVMVLPSLCLSATWGLGWLIERIGPPNKVGNIPRFDLIFFALALVTIGFPVDLLGLDETALKKLYPTDHAYSRTCLPHGEDYMPISETVFEMTDPGDLVTVGRQAPILGFLADRPYAMLYTHRNAESVERVLETSKVVVLDDTWENCFSGLTEEDRKTIQRQIERAYKLVSESGRIRLLESIQ